MFSKEINLKFEIDWKSVHLADVEWNVVIENDYYFIDFIIQSYGMTDKIFKYKSVTNVEGNIENNQLRPLSYKSKTKSTRQDVYANINFELNGSIKEFDISKKLDDSQISQQIELINKYQFFTDPISQLTQYFIFKTNSDRIIIDGLNIYSLEFKNLEDNFFEDKNPTIYKGSTKSLNLTFPFFQGLHKVDKKNNLQEIKMNYIEVKDINIPIQYQIKSKKFNASLYFKKYKIK